ncbi:MAG: alpha amylase N-terminal ig-like domain-containing protein [Treponema sp.]|nr:alpha amylase N-terminal ig-like domain-containing protein [Treponema sp.]
MDFSAVAHYAFDNYCYPLDKDNLAINIRTGKDIVRVALIWGDPFTGGIFGGKWNWHGERIEIARVKELPNHLWWSTVVQPPFKRCRYFFELDDGVRVMLYCENGFFTESELRAKSMPAPFIFPWMNEVDICAPPVWARSTVWYQIFPSRFCRVACSSDVAPCCEWAPPYRAVTNEEKYGGNLQGIISRLDYLEQLGVNGIYLNPVNSAPSEHKYDTTDYFTIDASFGTKDDMKRLVAQAHARGIKIMLDGVFNHTGWDFFAWQDVLKNRERSKYASWYIINNFDFDKEQHSAAQDGNYFAFAFVDNMPKLNTSNPEVRDYVLRACEMWVREYDIDAIRLDVANELSHVFCQELHTRLKKLKSDFFIVGEVWHNALPWLRGNEFDAVMNYPLQNAISNFALTPTMAAKTCEQHVNRCLAMYYEQTTCVQFNLLDSHDTIRLVTKTENRDATLQQFAFLFSMPGSVCIYYGTEVLLAGDYDPDCRRCMPWKEIDDGQYAEEFAFMQSLIALRKTHEAMRSVDMQFVYGENAPENGRVVHLKKKSDSETLNLFFNFGSNDIHCNFLHGNVLLARCCDGNTLHSGGFAIVKA